MAFIYRGLKAQLTKHTVTDEEIDRQIERLRQSNQRVAVIKDRPTRLGDEVVLDYAGFCGGNQFPGGTAENQTLVLGSGMFIPGFEEQLVDKVPEEPVTVQVTFPEKYHSEELAGKDAEFRCVIHEIRVKTPYEPDDTFAQEVCGFYTFAEMRQKMAESLQSYTDERGEMDLQDRLLRQAAATLELTVSDTELETAVDDQMKALEAQLKQQGLSLEMYCSFMNTTEADLRADARPDAEAAIRSRAAVERIAQLEQLQVSEDEMGQALALVARQNQLTVEQLKEYYDAELEKAIMNRVLTGKVMGLIRDAADITVVS